MQSDMPNQITGANAGERVGFAGKSRVVLSQRPGVAQFHRSAPRGRAVGREDFLPLAFLCDLGGLGVRRFLPHAEDAKDAKAGAGAPWQRLPSQRARWSLPQIFEIV